MKTLLNAGHGAGLSTTAGATVYAPCATTLLGSNATEANRQFKHREAGVVSRARVFVTANLSTGSSTVTLRKGGVDTALVVTIGALSTGWFEDTSNTVTVADGDLLGWKIIAGATSGPSIGSVVAQFEPTDTAAVISDLALAGPCAFATASATRYMQLAGRLSNVPASTEAHVKHPAQAAGSLRNLHCYVSANSRTQTTTIRTRVNTANGGQSLSIGSTATGLFEDTSNSDSIAQGDLLDYSMVTGTGTQTITIETVGVTFESTTGEIYQSGYVQGTSNSTASITRYLQIGGDLGSTYGHSTEANAQTKTNAATFSRLAVYVTSNSRTTTTTVTTRKNGADQALTVSIGSTATGLFEDTSNTFTVAADDLVNHAITWGTGAQAQVITFVGVGFAPASTISGTASASFGGTFTATGTVTVPATASAAFGGSFTATAVPSKVATASASFGGTFSASADSAHPATASATFGGSFSATATVTKAATAAGSFGGTFSASAVRSLAGTATASFGGTFAAAAVPSKVATASTDFGGSFQATAVVTVSATAAASFGGSFAASASTGTAATADASFGGSFAATATVTVPATAAASLGGTFVATGTVTHLGSASSTFGGTFSASATTTVVATAAAGFGGLFVATLTVSVPGTAAASFGGSFAATGTVTPAEVTVNATSTTSITGSSSTSTVGGATSTTSVAGGSSTTTVTRTFTSTVTVGAAATSTPTVTDG